MFAYLIMFPDVLGMADEDARVVIFFQGDFDWCGLANSIHPFSLPVSLGQLHVWSWTGLVTCRSF